MSQDPLGDLSIKPARDELVQRQQARGTRSARAPQQGQSKNKPSQPAPKAKANTGPLWALLVIMAVAMGGGGWYLWNIVQHLQVSLTHSTEALNKSEQALTNLQNNLDNRDKTLSQSGDQMTKDIRHLNSEVRKLWDVANKRNKDALEEHGRAISKLESGLKSTSEDLTRKLAAANSGVSDLKGDLQALKDSNKSLNAALTQQKTQLAALKSKVSTPSDLEDRVSNLEGTIQSINVYRKQVNSRLDQLDRQVARLYHPPATRQSPAAQ